MPKSTISVEEKAKFYRDIAPLAKEERTKLFESGKIENEISILEQMGFIIVKFPSSDTNLSGFCIDKGGNKCIYINTNITKGRQNFSLWHEYYHLITGEGIGVSYKDGEKYSKSEYKAHLFASLFLMPQAKVEEYLYVNSITMPFIRNEQLLEMANYFNVSFSAMLHRIIDMFPTYKVELGRRYATANNIGRLKDVARSKNLSLDYEEITKECYITKIFFELIEQNYNNKRITDEKLTFIKELLEKAKSKNV